MEALYQLSYSPETTRVDVAEPDGTGERSLCESSPSASVLQRRWGRPALSSTRPEWQNFPMDANDVFPSDVDADAERFVDDDDDEVGVPDHLGRHDEGSEADIADQQRAVPIDDDE